MVVLYMLAVVGYLLPAIIATLRGHHQQNAIGALNLLLGWTLLGWIGALVWSLTAVPAAHHQPVSTGSIVRMVIGLAVVGVLLAVIAQN